MGPGQSSERVDNPECDLLDHNSLGDKMGLEDIKHIVGQV